MLYCQRLPFPVLRKLRARELLDRHIWRNCTTAMNEEGLWEAGQLPVGDLARVS